MLRHFCEWVQSVGWIAGTDASPIGAAIVEVTHYFGMFLLVGSMGVVDLRIMGITGRSQSASELGKQVFPTMWVGFILVTLTGSLMAAATATQYYGNEVFYAKMLVILAATLLGIFIQVNVSKWDRLPVMPVWVKTVAFISLALWIGAILAGVEIPAITGVG